jgi:excisionase family DNA binding protein
MEWPAMFTIPPPPPPPIPPTECLLLCVEQVGAYLGGVSVRKVWELVSEKKIPAPLKLGRLSRWRRADLDEWAAGLR